MEGYKDLHEAIARGDKELVKRLVQDHPAEEHFSYNGSSALYKAFYNKEYKIASYLISNGRKFDKHDSLHSLQIDLTRVNYLLLHFNKKHERSSLFRLISRSQSPQTLDGEHLKQVMAMYENMFESEVLKLLMKVVENASLDIVYDFESETVNRIRRYNVQESEIYGLTSSREIFVGAKALLSADPQKRAKVYGVVAEELCHSALNLLFENHAKPYSEEDRLSKENFKKIVLNVKSSVERSCHVESVIFDVFRNYSLRDWECELIARVPHVVGIYEEEKGVKIFMEYPELSSLLCFYQQHVIPKCEQYIEDSRNLKHHQLMEEIRKKEDFMTYKEKTIQPLKEGFRSFTEHVVDENGISVITTNCTRLCMLHVYHELKRDSLEKKCLFFSRKCFDDKRYEILDTLKANVWEYFILVLDKKELSLEKLKAEYLCHFDSFKTWGIKVLVISELQSFGERFERKTLNYEWNDLSSEYQELRTCPIECIFKGKRKFNSIKTEDVPKVFQNESEIVQLMSGEPFLVEDGKDKDSRGFILETYLNRELKVIALKREILNNIPSDTIVFIFGLHWWDFEKLSIDKALVQWLTKSDDEIQRGRKIFIIEDEKGITLNECQTKIPGKKCICVLFKEDEFILRNAGSLDEGLNEYKKEIRHTEEQMVDVFKRNKILVISDNAGCGKSTVTSSLIRQVKESIYDSWVFRINLWKFSLNNDSDSEDSDEEEDLFGEIFQMIGLQNAFERWYFKQSWNQSDYFLFFDGYDEISSKYKSKALQLISFLRGRTNVNIVITTRKHDQQELEERLNTYSYQLVPFDEAEQVKCLKKMLKWKLKYPFGEGDKYSVKNRKAIVRKIENIIKTLEEKEESNSECQELMIAIKKIGLGGNLNSIRSEVDKLDLTILVESILNKTKLDEKIIEFMGIPLHLYMVGSIFYDDNFNEQIGDDLYTLYSKFIEHKILIYVEEKEGYSKEGNQRKKIVNSVTKDVFNIHTELANQFFDQGKEIEIKKEDAELCAALGIVSIHSGRTLFLHQTFAEYFKAESIRRNIEKNVFIEMISEKKYIVVKRFISCALEKKGFENISEELLKDLDFLFEVLKSIGDLCSRFDPFKINSDKICSIKIVKHLVKQFKLNYKSKLFHKFIKMLNIIVNNEMDNSVWIGYCLNLEIIKHLINGNFKFERELIFGFVRFAENVEEVIDVLNEFIFKECESGGNDEETLFNCIFELVRTEDSDENGLICYAISNERTEVFLPLLEYLEKVLGKEKFIAGLIESEEYKEQMKWTARNIHRNRICKIIREIHSKFENEINILFDFDFKFKVIWRCIRDDIESSNYFENVISLFIECLGITKLKELLQNEDSFGRYLVHEIMQYSTNANIVKNLDLVKNVLGEEIKDFLKIRNNYLENILHFAAWNGNEINVDFLNFYLSEEEIKELLLGRSEGGRTCLHSAAFWNNLRQLLFLINYAFEILQSDKSELEKILLIKDERGNTFLHSIEDSSYTSIEEIEQFFSYLRSKLSDEIFNKLMRIRNQDGKTFLQIHRIFKKEEVIECCKEILERDLFEELLRTEFEEMSE